MVINRFASFAAPLACLAAGALHAQAGGPGTPWRGAGAQPCFGIDDAAIQCRAPGGVIAIRAGHLFDSRAGQLLPASQTITTLSPLIGVRFKDRTRLSLQYDHITDNLARDATGVPTDLSNDQVMCRLQVDL